MKWSFRVARVFGIDVKVHFSFFLIIVIGAMQWRAAGPAGMAFGVGLMLLLFLCVTLHELGHSVVAQGFGVPVREIILLPIGGVAILGRNPSKPVHELLIAIAGPLVNVVIATLLVMVLGVVGSRANGVDVSALMRPGQPSLQLLLKLLLVQNVALVLFNMIPAFPLDGGRMLRAILAMFMGMASATRIAGTVGQLAAILLGIFGLMTGQIILTLIAVFIYMGAGAEMVDRSARAVLATRRVGDAYNKYALTLTLSDRVSRVVDNLLMSYQPDFAVVNRGQLVGIVTREDVLNWLAGNVHDVYVSEIMHENVVKVDATMPLDHVRELMAERQARVVAVYEGDAFLGLVSAEDIAEAHMILSFIQRQQETARPEISAPV
jgi:Zn-dependent protease